MISRESVLKHEKKESKENDKDQGDFGSKESSPDPAETGS
jgi:hypothetical protein